VEECGDRGLGSGIISQAGRQVGESDEGVGKANEQPEYTAWPLEARQAEKQFAAPHSGLWGRWGVPPQESASSRDTKSYKRRRADYQYQVRGW
jgi:hypothetical protein